MGTRDCGHICGESSPGIGEGGKTGDWGDYQPEIDHKKCTPAKQNKASCFQCWLYCPDGVISKTIPVKVNLVYCKGCGICAQVCPVHAITMVAKETSVST